MLWRALGSQVSRTGRDPPTPLNSERSNLRCRAVMSFKSFLRLPVELVSQILSFLEFQDLLRCSEVCKALRKIVDSSRLKYTIELAMHRMVPLESIGTRPSFDTRRRLLQEREHAWKHFKWRQKLSLSLPTTGSIYEFVGGFYGNAMAASTQISFVELPNATSNPASDVSGRSWIHDMPDISFVDFTMDPSQDLLVLLANALAESEFVYDVHLRTMSTGQPHAKAESSVLRSFKRSDLGTSDAESWFSVRIQVAGDFVALLVKESVDTVGGALEVWNYTRRPELSFTITLKIGIDDFSFVSSDMFIIVTPMGFIELWYFEDPSISESIPFAKAKYALPQLATGFIYWYMAMSANPTTGYVPPTDILSSSKPLCYPCPDERIHAFCIYLLNSNQLDGLAHPYVFFVNIHTFLHPSQPILEFMAASKEPIPWEIWGPHNTRWFSENISTDWQHALHGYRTVEIVDPPTQDTVTPPVTRPKLRLRDFNPYALARMKEVEDDFGGWRGRVVREPSTIPAQDAFAHDVVSYLPYREIVSEETFDVTDVMMDDGRILLLKRDDEGHLDGINVLTL